jgi:hypothetical protein
MYDSVTSERQEKQLQDENNENQILVKDPDGIQLLMRSELK